MSIPEEEKENRDLQQEERLALEAIYGPDAVQTSPISDDALVLVVNIDQDAEGEVKSQRVMILHVFLPATYPSKEPPDFEVSSVYCGSRRVDGKMLETIRREFHNMFQPGQVVLFEWISWLRDYLESEVEKSVQDLTQQLEQQTLEDTKDSIASEEQSAATSNNKPNGTEEDDGEPTPEIFSSEPLVDRKSVFVAHVAAVHSAKQVQKVMSKLLENKKIAKATHNIMAYRIVLDDGRVLQDNDDDGETAAGGRLMHLMQILDVKNVVVVVSRWFGGILLGADRFKDINNCARKALEDCGYIKEEQMSTESKSNKSKRKK